MLKFNWPKPTQEPKKNKSKSLISIEFNGPIKLDQSCIQTLTPVLLSLWQWGRRLSPWLIGQLTITWLLLQSTEGSLMTKELCEQYIQNHVSPIAEHTRNLN